MRIDLASIVRIMGIVSLLLWPSQINAAEAPKCEDEHPASALAFGVVRMNLAWEKDWRDKLDKMKSAGVRQVRLSLAPDFVKSFEIAKYAHDLGIEVLVDINLNQKSLFGADIVPRAGRGAIPVAQRLSNLDTEKYRKIVGDFFNHLDEAKISISEFEVGNEINSAAFNGDVPVLQEGKFITNLADLGKNRRNFLTGMRNYAEVVKITRDLIDRSKFNRQVKLLSAGLVSSFNEWGRKNGAVVVAPARVNRLYKTMGIAKTFDGRAIHIYPYLLKMDEAGSVSAGAKIRAALRQGLMACSPEAEDCYLTEWGFPAEFDRCSISDPRILHFQRFLKEASCARNLRKAYIFSWDGNDNFRIDSCHRAPEVRQLFK